MSAAYPNALFNWTARVNGNTVQAADPNTLATEIDAVEQYVGVNPHIEPAPLTGATSQFASLSARTSQAMLQSGHPYVQLNLSSQSIAYSSAATHTTQVNFNIQSSWPNYVMTGGSLIIQDAGVWLINVRLVWDYAASGWVQHTMNLGSGIQRRSVFNYSGFPSSGTNTYGERFSNQYGFTETTFMSRLSSGAAVNVAAGNYTNRNPLLIEGASLSAYYLRP